MTYSVVAKRLYISLYNLLDFLTWNLAFTKISTITGKISEKRWSRHAQTVQKSRNWPFGNAALHNFKIHQIFLTKIKNTIHRSLCYTTVCKLAKRLNFWLDFCQVKSQEKNLIVWSWLYKVVLIKSECRHPEFLIVYKQSTDAGQSESHWFLISMNHHNWCNHIDGC